MRESRLLHNARRNINGVKVKWAAEWNLILRTADCIHRWRFHPVRQELVHTSVQHLPPRTRSCHYHQHPYPAPIRQICEQFHDTKIRSSLYSTLRPYSRGDQCFPERRHSVKTSPTGTSRTSVTWLTCFPDRPHSINNFALGAASFRAAGMFNPSSILRPAVQKLLTSPWLERLQVPFTVNVVDTDFAFEPEWSII